MTQHTTTAAAAAAANRHGSTADTHAHVTSTHFPSVLSQCTCSKLVQNRPSRGHKTHRSPPHSLHKHSPQCSRKKRQKYNRHHHDASPRATDTRQFHPLSLHKTDTAAAIARAAQHTRCCSALTLTLPHLSFRTHTPMGFSSTPLAYACGSSCCWLSQPDKAKGSREGWCCLCDHLLLLAQAAEEECAGEAPVV